MKRIINTSKTLRKIDPKEVGEALGAEYIGKMKCRTIYKKKAAALLLISILSGTSCASWQEGANTTLNVISKATETTKNVGLSVLEVECITIAKKCFDANDTECPSLVECQEKRDEFGRYIFAIYQSLLAANVALSFENEKSTKEFIKKTQKLLLELYKAVEVLAPGLLPKSSELGGNE